MNFRFIIYYAYVKLSNDYQCYFHFTVCPASTIDKYQKFCSCKILSLLLVHLRGTQILKFKLLIIHCALFVYYCIAIIAKSKCYTTLCHTTSANVTVYREQSNS